MDRDKKIVDGASGKHIVGSTKNHRSTDNLKSIDCQITFLANNMLY